MSHSALAREISARFGNDYGQLVDELLELEKLLHARFFESQNVRGSADLPVDPGALSIDDFYRGDFSETVGQLEHAFGPCSHSAEVCFRLFGYFPGREPYTSQELARLIERVREKL